MSQILILLFFPLNCTHRSILPAPWRTKKATLQCMWNPIKLKHLGLCCCVWSIHPMGFLNIQTFESPHQNIFVTAHFANSLFYIRPKNRLHFYTPCQVLVINLDNTSSMAKFSWSFVRWAMLQTVNWGYFTQWNDAEHSTADNASSVSYYLQCHITRTYPMFLFFPLLFFFSGGR